MLLATKLDQLGGVVLAIVFAAAALWLLLNSRADRPFGAWFGRLLDDHNWRRIHRLWLALVAAAAVGLALGGASAGQTTGFIVTVLLLTGIVGYLAIAANHRRTMRGDRED